MAEHCSTAQFFEGRPQAQDLYALLLDAASQQHLAFEVHPEMNRISFNSSNLFGYVSFLKLICMFGSQDGWLTLSLLLPFKSKSRKVISCTRSDNDKWLHHILITDPAQIDEELIQLFTQAAHA